MWTCSCMTIPAGARLAHTTRPTQQAAVDKCRLLAMASGTTGRAACGRVQQHYQYTRVANPWAARAYRGHGGFQGGAAGVERAFGLS